MQNLYEKILKIKELAERGERGEAQAAKAKLELFLQKYNLTLNDIFQESRKKRMFRWHNTEEARLLTHILIKVTGCDNSRIGIKCTYAMLSEFHYFDVKQMYEWHIKCWRRERKDFRNAFTLAYYERHNLALNYNSQCECMKVNMEMAKKIFIKLNGNTYHKQIA